MKKTIIYLFAILFIVSVTSCGKKAEIKDEVKQEKVIEQKEDVSSNEEVVEEPEKNEESILENIPTDEERLLEKYSEFDFDGFYLNQVDTTGWSKKKIIKYVEKAFRDRLYGNWYVKDEGEVRKFDKYRIMEKEYKLISYAENAPDEEYCEKVCFYFTDKIDIEYNLTYYSIPDYSEIAEPKVLQMDFESYEEESNTMYNYTQEKMDEIYDNFYNDGIVYEQYYSKKDVYKKAKQEIKDYAYQNMGIVDAITMAATFTWDYESIKDIYFDFDKMTGQYSVEFGVTLNEYQGLGESFLCRFHMEYQMDENGKLQLLNIYTV